MQTLMDKVVLITDAIRDRRQLTFMINVHARQACPHVLGTKQGKWHLFAWQFAGTSSHALQSGEERWRCFEVADISDLLVQDGEWHRGWITGKRDHHSLCMDNEVAIVDPAYAAETQSAASFRIPPPPQRRARP